MSRVILKVVFVYITLKLHDSVEVFRCIHLGAFKLRTNWMEIFFETVCEVCVWLIGLRQPVWSTRGDGYICPLPDSGVSSEEGVLAMVCSGLVDNHIAQLSSTNTNTDYQSHSVHIPKESDQEESDMIRRKKRREPEVSAEIGIMKDMEGFMSHTSISDVLLLIHSSWGETAASAALNYCQQTHQVTANRKQTSINVRTVTMRPAVNGST